MPDDIAAPAGYAAAADLYWQAGWRGILPLPRKHKKTPPRNFTGKTGADPSYPDLAQWAELYPDGNLCLRLPADVIGVDVDAYGAKTGAAALAEAEKRWGPLPDTVTSTSRGDGISGIRFYRIPAGIQLAESIEFADLGVGDIEIVQRGHRYALVWPSIHPEGGSYWWYNQRGQHVAIPHVDDLPALPAAWLTQLAAAPPTNGAGLNGARYHIRDALTDGEPSVKVAGRLRQAIKELNLPGHSRHDTTRGHVLALERLGKSGEPGVECALIALGEMFIALITPDRPGGKDEATREYKAMVIGQGAAQQLAQPCITDWVKAINIEDCSSHGSGNDVGKGAELPPGAAGANLPHETRPRRCDLAGLEHGFWDTRDCLQAIWTTALARMCSPWAVLAQCAARALTLIPPHIVLPPVIGGPGSLNWFTAIVARSGGGKGASAAAAALLIPAHITTRPVGSGEGIVKAFRGTTKNGDPLACDSLLVTIDEIDALTAVGGRQGSTTMSILRQAFSGETLGFSYADPSKNNQIERHTYRMTAVVAVQPERAGALFADSGGGTPQRFMWFPGTDPRISLDTPWPAGALTLPAHTDFLYPRELAIPDQVRDYIRAQHVARQHPDTEALDGHAIFCREKFAYALALLDGRPDMTLDDWELSGVAAAVSGHTRQQAAHGLQAAAARLAAERGAVRGIEMDAADVERSHQQVRRGQRVVRWLLHQLHDGPQTLRELSRAVASRDRPMLDGAIQKVVEEGLAQWNDSSGGRVLVRL